MGIISGSAIMIEASTGSAFSPAEDSWLLREEEDP